MWGLILAFLLSAVFFAAAESYYTIFVLNRMDEKFRQAPDAAFELSLFGDAVVVLLGLLLFSCTLVFSARKNIRLSASGIYRAVFSGGLYMTLPVLLDWCRVEMPVSLFWIWAVLIPIVAARVTLRGLRPSP